MESPIPSSDTPAIRWGSTTDSYALSYSFLLLAVGEQGWDWPLHYPTRQAPDSEIVAMHSEVDQPTMCQTFRKAFVPHGCLSEADHEDAYQRVCLKVSKFLKRDRIHCQCMRGAISESLSPLPITPVAAAFKAAFKNAATPKLLLECLHEVQSRRLEYYAPTVTIVQHSCSGKTRTCMELGLTCCPMLYLCFREKHQNGYPTTTDTNLREYLLFGEGADSTLTQSPLEVYLRYAAFCISALLTFRVFWENLSSLCTTDIDSSIRSHLEAFLNAQLRKSSSLLTTVAEVAYEIETDLRREFETLLHNPVLQWDAIEATVVQRYLSFPSLCIPGARKPIGLICIDEEHIFGHWHTVLNAGKLSVERQSLSIHLQRAMRLLKDHSIAMIRMDTTSKLDVFRPKESKLSGSSRQMSAEGFGHCIFSLMLSRNIGDSSTLPVARGSLVNTISYMARFGCPYWHSLMESSNRCTANDMLETASIKLLASKAAFTDIPNELTSAAILGATAHLDIVPWMKTSHDLVAGHMAQLQRLRLASGQCVAAYPADCVLAAAAMQQLEVKLSNHLTNVAKIVSRQLTSKDELVELLGRLVCLLAATCPVYDSNDPQYSVMNLRTFINRLCGASFESQDTVTTKMMDGIINLRQFVPTDQPITSYSLCLAAQRGFGFITKVSQDAFDAVIPVVLKHRVDILTKTSAEADSAATLPSPPAEVSPVASHASVPVNARTTTPEPPATEAGTPVAVSADLQVLKKRRKEEKLLGITSITPPPVEATASCRFDLHNSRLKATWTTCLNSPDASKLVQNGELTYEQIMSTDTSNPATVSWPATDPGDVDFAFTPEHMTMVAVQTKFRSENMTTIALEDPLKVFISEHHHFAQTLPRMALGLLFRPTIEPNVTFESPYQNVGEPSGLLITNVRNPHLYLSKAAHREAFDDVLAGLMTYPNKLDPPPADARFSETHYAYLKAANTPIAIPPTT